MSDRDGPPRDHQRDLTDRIVAALEAGTPPWRRPWTTGSQAPINAATGRHYAGANVLVLGMDARAWETGDPRWATFNQAKARGWSVRRGERATMVFYVGMVEDRRGPDGREPTPDEPGKAIPFFKAFPVFHASQIEGIPAYRAPTLDEAPWRRPEGVQTILDRSGADIRIGGSKAFYSPSTDHIQLPPDDAFAGRQQWAATALHELAHWTGHPSRLNRDLSKRFGTEAYAQEELRAELASVFVGAELGLPSDIPQHASYVGSWIKALKEDKREIFRAAADASRASELVLGFHPDLAASRAAEAKRDAEERAEQERTPKAEPAPTRRWSRKPVQQQRRAASR